MDSGHCHSPPQPTVRPQKTEVCNFGKTSAKATGAVGVLTYDIMERNNVVKEKIAIMFSVPYDYNLYKNWVAVGIYDIGTKCDESLYKDMYNNKDQKQFVRTQANGCGIMYEGQDVVVMCTMSPMGRAILKLEVWDKVFSQQMEQRYH